MLYFMKNDTEFFFYLWDTFIEGIATPADTADAWSYKRTHVVFHLSMGFYILRPFTFPGTL